MKPSLIFNLYDNWILKRAKVSLTLLLVILGVLGTGIKDFRLDASSDTLILEDEEVRYYRAISARYEGGDFVFVTFTPKKDLFSEESLNILRELRQKFRAMKRVESVTTLLDVPLLRNPPGPLSDLADNIKALEDKGADLNLAIKEFQESPIYENLIVSSDSKSTALLINFRVPKELRDLQNRRSEFAQLEYKRKLTPSEQSEYKKIIKKYRELKDHERAFVHEDISKIRRIVDSFKDRATLYIGGVPMIVDDILEYIRKDLSTFGFGMILFLILALGMIFKNKRWVILPMSSCALSVYTMIGLLGYLHWDVTVVSSNFISLQLIFTMSLAIHIIVRYREFMKSSNQLSNYQIVKKSVQHTFTPCLYASLTTMAGFASLVVCDILPVVHFGWMMSMGLAVSLVITFTLIPATLMLLDKPNQKQSRELGQPLTSFFARVTEKRGNIIIVVSVIIAIINAIGISKIEVENSFVDYFKEKTEIYQGMKFIDKNLGGTAPLDVIINFKESKNENKISEPLNSEGENTDDSFDDFSEFEETTGDSKKYWYTQSKLELINKVHDYLDSLPASGKVMSLATAEKTIREIEGGQPLDNFTLALLFSGLPDKFQEFLVKPYASVEDGQARINVRIKDSLPNLRRDVLIKKINRDIEEKIGLDPENFHVTGTMVLYNNMLQSLFSSQIKTIGYTVLALFLMFMLSFRSIKISFIAILPNVLSSLVVLGIMGLTGIPLDVMTITIVAISIGIAVDDTIHYLHRFKEEIGKDWDYVKAMYRCHDSIGSAMYYTSLTITIGFSILCFSNFIPTILFGVLTALAMLMALAVALNLLPRLIIIFKPFGKGSN